MVWPFDFEVLPFPSWEIWTFPLEILAFRFFV